MEVQGRKTLIVGAGKSGVASAIFLAARGAEVSLFDKKPMEDWTNEARGLAVAGVDLLAVEIPSSLFEKFELVVISPGVPTESITSLISKNNQCEVIGEIELAFRFLKGKIVGITGSNGKTTTTTLVGELLKNSGIPTQVGGNIGTPLLNLAETSAEDGWTVVELSSFQLETIKQFRPDVAVALNVTPNHLDRYDSFEDYASAKRRLFMNQTPSDAAILNADDEITLSWAKDLKARVILFSTSRELENGFFLRGRELVMRHGATEKILTTRDEMTLRGIHNVQNVLASLAVGVACGASTESMRDTVRNFRAVEHRLEFVCESDGVSFYNDSKATSVDATLKALEALSEEEGRIILILGGRGKNAPYAPLAKLIQEKVRALVLIGEDADNIEHQLKKFATIIRAKDMHDAVLKSRESALSGDSVLLAPACASFDMFKSFEERGSVFKNEVTKAVGSRQLAEGSKR